MRDPADKLVLAGLFGNEISVLELMGFTTEDVNPLLEFTRGDCVGFR